MIKALKKMKHWKKAITTLTIIAVVLTSVALFGCGDSEDVSDSEESQTVKVTRGNLMTTISSFGSISMPNQAELTFGSGSTSTVYTVSEVNVKFGDTVKEGDVLAKLDTASLERAVEQEEADLRTADINLEQLYEQFSNSAIADAQATVRDAEVSLENTQRTLTTTRSNCEIDILNAEDAADDAYTAYIDFLIENTGQLTQSSVAEQKDDLYLTYEEELDDLETVVLNCESSIATAANNVAKAEDTLRNEQEDLAEMLAGPEDNDVELLQIQVDNAQIALDDAKDQLEAATILAPFDGIVAVVGAIVGDEVTTNTVIVHLVNTSDVEIDAAVDEIDVASVKAGQIAIVELDAIPDARMKGTVTAISPIATSQSGVTTYDIAVDVQNADTYDLKEGMSATITIMAMDVQNVLLVPSNAVQRTIKGNAVQVVIGDDQTEERIVEIGATNGQQTEIISGLSEGEEVIVQGSNDVMKMIEEFMKGGGFPGGMGGMRGK